jgi:hypothetical protein
MKLTINTDPQKHAMDNPGMDVGLDSIVAWLANKQIQAQFMNVGTNTFGMQMTDGTTLLFIVDTHKGPA